MLWLFDNAHSLTDEQWNKFEPKLAKFCRKHNTVVLSSIEAVVVKNNLVFNNFEEKSKTPKILEMRELTLNELSADEIDRSEKTLKEIKQVN